MYKVTRWKMVVINLYYIQIEIENKIYFTLFINLIFKLMNKKFYLALVATAALFASCSSDDVIGNARENALDENAPAKIEIGIAPTVEVSRGTGRVGDTSTGDQWAGQEFSVLMLEKGTMMGAYEDVARTTSIIKGTKMTATGTAVVSLENDAIYYPTTSANGAAVYDFWGYRLDNSEVLNASEVDFQGYDDATATQIAVPFEINGTQDIMVATTAPSDAAYAAANPNNIYSAKSARNGVKPNLSFKHLLSSLTFKVKAKSRDITTAATNPTTDANWQPGYQITNITLKSKATGKLVVAYTGDVEPDRIVWDAAQDWADPSTLTTFQLQRRKKEVNSAADIKMVIVSSNASVDINYPTGYVDMAGRTSYPIGTGDLLTMDVYDSNDLSTETGLPTGRKTTLQAMLDATSDPSVVGYILAYKAEDRVSYESTAKNYECDYKATSLGVTSDLVPFVDNADVDPVVLGWTGYSAGAAAHTDAVEQPAMDATAYGALGAALQGGDVDAADLAAATIQANDGKYFHNTDDGKYYQIVYTAEVAAAAGTAEVATVGEPMLAAPSDDAANSGYQVFVTYKYWKKQSASQAVQVTKTTEAITVNNYTMIGGARSLGAFQAGKNYNVTITLYSDGEVLNGEATSEPWEDGGDLDAGDE